MVKQRRIRRSRKIKIKRAMVQGRAIRIKAIYIRAIRTEIREMVKIHTAIIRMEIILIAITHQLMPEIVKMTVTGAEATRMEQIRADIRAVQPRKR